MSREPRPHAAFLPYPLVCIGTDGALLVCGYHVVRLSTGAWVGIATVPARWR